MQIQRAERTRELLQIVHFSESRRFSLWQRNFPAFPEFRPVSIVPPNGSNRSGDEPRWYFSDNEAGGPRLRCFFQKR